MINALMSYGWVILCDCWCDTDVDDFNNNDEYGDVVVVDDDDDDGKSMISMMVSMMIRLD